MEVAQALGQAQGVVSKWESDKQRPTIDILPALATLLAISINEMFVGVDPTYDAVSRDLSGHTGTRSSTLHPGGVGADDSTATRVRELEARVQQLEHYELFYKRLKPLLVEGATALGVEDDSAEGTPPTRRRNARRPRR